MARCSTNWTNPNERLCAVNASVLFFNFALLASYTAAENIDLMLRLADFPAGQRLERVQEVLALVDLTRWADHFPHELSGGQQQRVAIARAIAPRPACCWPTNQPASWTVKRGKPS